MLLLAVASLLGCSSPYPTRHSAPSRVGGRLLRDARRADALGLTPTAGLTTSPRIGDVVRALGSGAPESSPWEAMASAGRRTGSDGYRAAGNRDQPEAEGGESVSADNVWFSQLIRRYNEEIEDALDESDHQATFLAPLEDPQLRLVYVDGAVKFYNEQGREFSEGLNFYLSNRSVVRVANHLLFTVDPEFSFVENKNDTTDDSDTRLNFQEFTASVRLGPTELTAGRMPLWWGPGRHGALLLSNNARPFDLVRLSTAGPQLLPGFLSYLGLIQAETFLTQLERGRAVEKPYLAGFRLSTRLNPWFEFGVSRTAQFGGKGRSVTAETIWDVITGRTENAPDDPGNQIAALDGRLIVPWKLQPFEAYAELGGEDEAGGFLSKEAYLIGLYLPRIGPWHLAELTIEYTDTTVDGDRRVWYTNRNYPDGYTYRHDIIGHHVGTDGLDIFVELRLHPFDDETTFFVSYDFEEHFRQDPVEETLHQFRFGVEAHAWRGLWVTAFYQHDRWKNFQLVSGNDETGHALGLGARWQF